MDYEYAYQSEKKDGRNNASHAIVPLTVAQVLSLTKEGQIQHQEFQHIVLIGKLASCTLQGHKYKININDGTGVLELTSLTGGQKTKNSVVNEDLSTKKGRYYFVVLTAKLRKENNEWTYFLDNLREITNHNEVTKHISDVILSHLQRTR